jgi:hypothetical protein
MVLATVVTTGPALSRTSTEKVQLALLPAPSWAEQVTSCEPSVTTLPGGGVQLVLATEQLSLTVGA